jgi:hypothetical protein
VHALARVVESAPRADAAQPEVRVTARRRAVRAVRLSPVHDDDAPPIGVREDSIAVAAEAAGGEG